MTWCPRCDIVTPHGGGEACDVCGALTIDARSARPSRRSALQVLELDPTPPDTIEETILPAAPAVPPSPRPGRVRRALRAAPSRRGLAIALALTVVAGGTVSVALTRHAPKRPAVASTKPSSPSSSPAAPPLGHAFPGRLAIAASNGLRILDLTTGKVETVPVPNEPLGFAFAPDGRTVAYVDSQETLYVSEPNGAGWTPIETQVQMFTWAPDASLILARTEHAAGKGAITRIERLHSEARVPSVLTEMSGYPVRLAAGGPTYLVEVSDVDGRSAVHAVTAKPSDRVVRRNVRLLDVSPDGARALVAAGNTSGVYLMQLSNGSLTRIGPGRLFASSARFSPDGSDAILVATTAWHLESGDGCTREDCGSFPFADEGHLWRLDVSSRSIVELPMTSTDPELGRPVWGPEEQWVFVLRSGVLIGLRPDGSGEVHDLVIGDSIQNWIEPQHLT